ncbi:hypothetical protein [Salipiger thiooxidans]|uniref:hypothetical protein n=1 Tax=Salipiger thiooxidans TaxID=282683 RepID=UPI001CD21CBE|nr:hypothetical protein [Salipiger thiooxidans]MCA0850573.1 hypothetical protein [Salipiger thiooxidans]
MGVALAASGAQVRAMPFVRCLRHARVGAPTVLLSRGHALRDNGAMGYDSVGKMIVRSIRPAGGPVGTATGPDDRDRKRATPTVAQRLVLVPQATAARHHAGAGRQAGVFDRLESKGAPPGALSKVKYGRQGAKGFPVARTTTKPGFDGVRHEVSRRLETDTDPGRIAPDDELANPVFAPEYGQRTPTTYYPDPAADTLVIRLRRGGGEAAARAILPESPRQVPVAASRYPDGLPVLLSLRQSRRRDRMAEPSHATVLTPPREVFFDALAEKDIVRLANGGYRATEVELLLQPGDHFEVEMWLVPSAWRLAHDFAAVQSMAQYLCKRGGATVDCNVETLLNGIAKEGSATMEGLEGTAGGVRYVGPGGDILPPTRMLLTLAERLYAHMLRHPVHEIAGVRRIEAIHAVNVHDERPRAHALPPGIDPFPGRDPEPLPQTAIRAIRPARLGDAVAGFSDDTAIAAGSKHLALTGTVEIDREFVDTLEIVARTVSPQSAVFDDPDRRRSLAHRLAGTWPASLDQPGTPRQARHVFGFRVAADGRVRLPEGEVTLLRIDNLPLPRPEDRPGRRSIDLAPYFLQLGEQATATSRRHVFPDGKARRLDIRINALACTAEMMATAARQIGSADPWLATSGVVVEKGDLVGSEPVSRQLLANFSDRVEVIMPATVRPAAVRAKAPVPVFETTVETFVGDGGRPGIRVLRRAKTRIPLGRGWFDSGVDERLGLVIWPPGQELQDHPDLAANYVWLRDGIADSPRTPLLPGGICPGGELGEPPQQTAPGRRVKLPDFEDDDLGPGGRFVTRRGMDPVRIGDGLAADPSETQVFLSKEAFPDLWRDPSDPALAEYVPHAMMPLADAGEAAAAKDGTRTEDQVPPMAVGLVVYAPRFDPELEEWYPDVHLRPGVRADSFVRFGLVRYQPHTRPNLRCSRPVVQWAQPLPDRTVTVETTGMHGHEVLTVTMSGPVSIGRARQATSGDTALKVQEDARDAPVMRVSLFEERRTAAGGLGRITLELPPRAAAAIGSVLATTGGDTKVRHEVRPSTVDKGQATWTWTLPLVSLPGTNFGRLKLAVDEIEYFLPASLGTGREPLAADALATFDSALWQEAGPRFSTVVNLADLVPIAKTPSD